MKTFTYKSAYDSYANCVFQKNTYLHNENTALSIIGVSGEPITVCTINFEKLPPDQAYIKDYSENVGMLDFLQSIGVVTNIIALKQSGFEYIPLCQLDLEKIKEYGGK